jgi:hypothetical protein
MPMFEVTVVASGIRLPMNGREAVGFFRMMKVSAVNPVGAETEAVSRARAEWYSTGHAKLNQGAPPTFRVEQTSTLPWWSRFLPRRRGYVFFEKDSEG